MSRGKKGGKGLTAEESALFREAVKRVQPIHSASPAHLAPVRKPRLRQNQPITPDPAIVEEDGELFRRTTISARHLNQLKRGLIRYQSSIDLHGLTVAQAKRLLRSFIKNSSGIEERCVLVITGKGLHSDEGYSALRHAALSELRSLVHVQAYCWAQPKDGGSGAFYVLIRKPEH